MALTSKQKDDLNNAIAEYFQKQNFISTLSQFQQEAQLAQKQQSEGP